MRTALEQSAESSSAIVETALREGRTALDEHESKTLLAASGIPVPAGGLARSEAEALALAASIAGAVALKAVGASIHHKTEAQLVVLDLREPDEVAAAYRGIVERAGDDLEAVLVEEMVAGTREFMVGMKRDAAFGAVVAFGLGGTMTEVFHDIVLAIAPIDEGDVTELLGLIHAQPLLGAFRGQPAVDRRRLVDMVLAVARLAEENPHIAEIDLNPVIICGDRPVAADALIVLSSAPPEAAPARCSHLDLRAVCAPRSVAVVGASGDVEKWGGSALRNILDGGFEGPIYPVSPRGGTFFGLPVYKSIEELPEAPDLALLAIGGKQVGAVLEQCGRRGVHAAVVIAAGFSETGADGRLAETELAETAAAAGVTVIGPNCMGLVSNETRLHATGFITLHPPQGPLSLVSQSGNLGVQVVMASERRGIGLDKFVGVGNEVQVSVVDVLDYLRTDARTECVLMYIEGIDDGRHFLDVAAATTARKPLVVVRGGLTESGGKAAASHTGAMAGSAAVYEAAARQAGVITCTAMDEALDLAVALANLPLPRGRRVAVVTNGGGAGVLAADEMARRGLILPELPAELIEELNEVLPPFWSRRNPLDMVASAGGDVGRSVLAAVARSDAFDAVVMLSALGVPNTGSHERATSASGEYDGFSAWESDLLALTGELIATSGKPIIHVPDLPMRQAVFAGDGRYSAVVLPSPRAVALTLDRMAWYGDHRRRHAAASPDDHD
jgi:acyl-CoA synthetase (NDP forming)